MDGDQRDKVLLVEDDLLLSMVAERLINSFGYQVIGKARTGKEAIQQADECNPDVIIMDILLEGSMNGIEAMKEIRKRLQIPVIYLSGSTDYMEQARETSCSEYLTKPIKSHDLEPLLTQALSDSQADTKETLSMRYSEE